VSAMTNVIGQQNSAEEMHEKVSLQRCSKNKKQWHTGNVVMCHGKLRSQEYSHLQNN